MTDLAEKIWAAIADLHTLDGGLVKSRVIERVDEVLAAQHVTSEPHPHPHSGEAMREAWHLDGAMRQIDAQKDNP